MVKASLIGSILGNTLLVAGAAMVVGGIGRDRQFFDRTAASAQSSMKKSNGLITLRSAISPTVMVSRLVGFGNTSRARKLPTASCCQLMKWFAGSMRSE